MKKKLFRFLIILLISFSIILAFSESVKTQEKEPLKDLKNWKLSIDLDTDKCSPDHQIKIGKNPLFCLKDVADLPHPDSPDYWKQHSEKIEKQAKIFSNNLTTFANTSTSVEDLEISEELDPFSQKCKKKDDKIICDSSKHRYFLYKKISFDTKNKYFDKKYNHLLMTIGITPKIGFYTENKVIRILESTLEERCRGLPDIKKCKKLLTTILENNENKDNQSDVLKEMSDKAHKEISNKEEIDFENSLFKILKERKKLTDKLNQDLIKTTFTKKLTEIQNKLSKQGLEEHCRNDDNDKEREKKCKNDDEEQVKQEIKEKYKILFQSKDVQSYIELKVEEYRNDYGLNTSKQPPQDSQQIQEEQPIENEQKTPGLRSQAVKVGDETIFYIRTWHNRISPQARAKKANEKIYKILNNEIDIQGLGVFSEPSENNQSTNANETSSEQRAASKVIRIISNDPLLTEDNKMILTINQNDAALEDEKSTEILAKKRLEKIMRAIDRERDKLQKRKLNFSNGLVGAFIKLNGKPIFYIKPDVEEESFDSSFRATVISQKINSIADKWLFDFDENALMAAYLMVNEQKKEQTICILADSWPSEVRKNNLSFLKKTPQNEYSQDKCSIDKLEQNNSPLVVLYSKTIWDKIKNNENKKGIKVLTISDSSNSNDSNNNYQGKKSETYQVVNFSWEIITGKNSPTNTGIMQVKKRQQKEIYKHIMQIKRNDPDLETFQILNTREALAIDLVRDILREEIADYRYRSMLSAVIFLFFLILSIFLLWSNDINNFINNLDKNDFPEVIISGFRSILAIFLPFSKGVDNYINNLHENYHYSSNKCLQIVYQFLLVMIPLLLLSIILSCLLYNNDKNFWDFLKIISDIYWLLVVLLSIFLGWIFVQYDTNHEWSQKLLRKVYLFLRFLIPLFFLINLFSSFFTFNHIIKLWQTRVFLFINQQFDKIWVYIHEEVPYIIFFVTLAFVAYIFVDVVIKKVFSSRQKNNSSVTKAIFHIIVFLIIVFLLISIAPHLPGANTIYFQGISAFIILIFTWSASSVVGDFIAGVILIFGKSLHEGDWIKIGEVFGRIKEQDLLVHRIKTPKNSVITIPNSTILKELTTNFGSKDKDKNEDKLILYTPVGLGYDVPREKVEQTLILAAVKTDKVLFNPRPFVLLTTLGDFAVTYELNVYTKEVDNIPKIYSDLHKSIQDECNKAGIEILSPNYLAIRDGTDPTIPKPIYSPKN